MGLHEYNPDGDQAIKETLQDIDHSSECDGNGGKRRRYLPTTARNCSCLIGKEMIEFLHKGRVLLIIYLLLFKNLYVLPYE